MERALWQHGWQWPPWLKVASLSSCHGCISFILLFTLGLLSPPSAGDQGWSYILIHSPNLESCYPRRLCYVRCTFTVVFFTGGDCMSVCDVSVISSLARPRFLVFSLWSPQNWTPAAWSQRFWSIVQSHKLLESSRGTNSPISYRCTVCYSHNWLSSLVECSPIRAPMKCHQQPWSSSWTTICPGWSHFLVWKDGSPAMVHHKLARMNRVLKSDGVVVNSLHDVKSISPWQV